MKRAPTNPLKLRLGRLHKPADGHAKHEYPRVPTLREVRGGATRPVVNVLVPCLRPKCGFYSPRASQCPKCGNKLEKAVVRA